MADYENSMTDFVQGVIDKWREYITLKIIPLLSFVLHAHSC